MADSGEAGESDGEERDSRASIMSRGGKHEDTSALGKMRGTVQAWVDNPLTAAQIESKDEGGQEEDEDDEEESQVGASGAGVAAAQGPVDKQRASEPVGWQCRRRAPRRMQTSLLAPCSVFIHSCSFTHTDSVHSSTFIY